MTTPLGFAAKMGTLAVSVPSTLPAAVYAAGQMVEKSVESFAPSFLRNVGRGARIGAKTLPPKKLGSAATALVKATGPFHLIEKSIAAHTIEPRQVGAAVNNPLVIPGSKTGFAAYARHPGVKRSVGPFAKGVAAARPIVPRVMHEAVLLQMRAVIR